MAGLDPDAMSEILADLDVEVDLEAGEDADGEIRLKVDAASLVTLMGRLRDHSGTAMRRLVDLTAIDRGEGRVRFEMVYRLHAPAHNVRLRVHVEIGEPDPAIDSVVGIWPAANWLEREVFDLFGIHFSSHPDLRRILLEADFEGAPLRKDFPRQPHLATPEDVVR